jgi:hypothetical protein
MCHERERLIGYVYDECEPDERQQVAAHLARCEACRQEIGDLRRVREDLLAFDVPEHGSVWRPFVPSRIAPSWRDVPAWAMAAAAAVVFIAGAAGGVASQAWFRPAAPAVRAAAEVPATVRPADWTPDEMNRLEQRLIGLLRSEIDDRVEEVATQQFRRMPRVSRTGGTGSIDMTELVDRLDDLERWKYQQMELNIAVHEKLNPFVNYNGRRPDMLQQTAFGPMR